MMVITLLAELGALVPLRIPNILQQKAEDSDDQDDDGVGGGDGQIPLHSVKFHYTV